MITPLPFDSKLFGYPVGKVDVSSNWNEEEFLRETKDFNLVYLFSKKPLSVKNTAIREVDTKLIFEKELAEHESIQDIELNKMKELYPKLQELAFQSGVYSRFKNDTRLDHQEFEKLYSIWIQKAFEKDFILTDTDLNGMITFSIHQEKAAIGLFAVSENSRGKGLGRKLILAAEHYSQSKGARSLSISTQAANNSACSLYSKLGYQLAAASYVYHFVSSK